MGSYVPELGFHINASYKTLMECVNAWLIHVPLAHLVVLCPVHLIELFLVHLVALCPYSAVHVKIGLLCVILAPEAFLCFYITTSVFFLLNFFCLILVCTGFWGVHDKFGLFCLVLLHNTSFWVFMIN